MKKTHSESNAAPQTKRTKRRTCAIIALMSTALFFGVACDEEEAFRAFREAASSNIQSGVKTAMDGIIDGVFAIIEQGTSGSTDTTNGSETTDTAS